MDRSGVSRRDFFRLPTAAAIASVASGADSGVGALYTPPASAFQTSQSDPSGTPARTAATLEEQFRNPPVNERPWVYYWWVKGNVTRQSITRDLEQMKAKGIGGFLLFDARGYGENLLPPPPAPIDFLSPEWRELVKFTMSEARRLDLRMSMNLSTHGGSLRAPWKTGANAPKKLIWTSTGITGPRRFDAVLTKPDQPYFWEAAVLAVRHEAPAKGAEGWGQWRDIIFTRNAPGIFADEVVDLTDKVRDGRITWDAPAGNWTILRFGAVTMEGHETDVDILNVKAVEEHFQRMGRMFLTDAGALAGKTLTYFYNVSWEGASPTWTPGFNQDFLKYRGYSDRPYLPVLAGMTVRDEQTSARFLEDYSRTIGDCFLNNCYRRLGELCHEAGVQWHSESGGPWDREKPLFRFSDQLAFWGANDMPQGEFWHDRWETRPDGTKVWLSNMRRAAMAAHIYGRPLVAAESFTNMNRHWQEYPAVLKPDIDAAFVDGTNQVMWHTFDGSPAEFGKPGIVYFAGTHLNPNVTWWNDAGGFLSYLGRSQVMLRRGKFVADACVYTSYINYLRWGRDKTWSEKASLELPPGYAYDLINTEALVNRVSVRDGNLILPDGMSYRMLVLDLDENVIPPAALAKIVALARSGATVVLGSRRPERARGLHPDSDADAEVRRLADELWGAQETFGKGRVFRTGMRAALDNMGLAPDFSGPFEYIHRKSHSEDVYFLSGSGRADCTFRVNGKEPELWDPVTGKTRDAIVWRRSSDGRTIVPIELPEHGSVFVVFRRPASDRHFTHVSNYETVDILERNGRGARVRVWRSGPVVFTNDRGASVDAGSSSLPALVELQGPWQVRFQPGRGAPASVIFDRLAPWNDDSRPGIRYFSGTATYHKTFKLDAARAARPMRLELGEVKDIARVSVNGKPLGVVWTAPWSIDLTGVVKPGVNELEIAVTNTWANRLIGDAALPEDQRITKTIVRRDPSYKGRLPYLRGYLATDPLLRSGLIGPVRLEFGEEREVRF